MDDTTTHGNSPLGLPPPQQQPSPTHAAAPANDQTRKRTLRACDGCRHRRMKCSDIRVSASTGKLSCRVCREYRQDCTYDAPVKKRGPQPGRRRIRRSTSPLPAREDDRPSLAGSMGSDYPPKPISTADGGLAMSMAIDREGEVEVSPIASPRSSTPRILPQIGAASRPPRPLLGLSPKLVDQLLAVYFTHVHNVWPLIYKPLFNPHTTSAPLLLAMLAIAACVAPHNAQDTPDGLDQDKLFRMAERALHHCRMESRIDIIQTLILLSLRQTGNGEKRSAFLYGGRAFAMALDLGLNLDLGPGQESAMDRELRSRVYWNCYVLDKGLSEETGRSFFLPYRRSSTPLPSTSEVDELEAWPPLPTSSQPMPKSVRHITPRRGHVMSCFAWTCRLAMVVEDILNLDTEGPPAGTEPWDARFKAEAQYDIPAQADKLTSQLDGWRAALPAHLEIDPSPNVSPLPHYIVGMAWYHSAKILLHSRFIKQPANLFQDQIEDEVVARAHATCTTAAEGIIDMLSHLDRFKLLGQVSSDMIHMLSLATLFEAYDATHGDIAVAHRAKINFAQCCVWLRDLSASWPASSAHKLYFEGLIQGGMKLSSQSESPTSPSSLDSPSMPVGLRAVGRNLSTAGIGPGSVSSSGTGPGGGTGASGAGGGGVRSGRGTTTPAGLAPSLFQLPQFYWNHLSHSLPPQYPVMDSSGLSALDLMFSPDAVTSALPEWNVGGQGHGQGQGQGQAGTPGTSQAQSTPGTTVSEPHDVDMLPNQGVPFGAGASGPASASASGTGTGTGTGSGPGPGGRAGSAGPPKPHTRHAHSNSQQLVHNPHQQPHGANTEFGAWDASYLALPQTVQPHLDQDAIYNTLLSFMVEATKGS